MADRKPAMNNPKAGQQLSLQSDDELNAFQQTKQLLESSPSLLAIIPSVVSLRNVDVTLTGSVEDVRSLLTPILGHHALTQALEELKAYEKIEADLQNLNPLTAQLTSVVTGTPYSSSKQAISSLKELCKGVPRRVCQHPFKRNDIVWVCRTCQADETCVLCHACFTASNHEGHDVAFYHAQAGGCCDCGDPDAWDPQGFCPNHGPASSNDDDAGPLDSRMIRRVQGVVPSVLDWMVSTVAETAQKGFSRAQPSPSPVGNEADATKDASTRSSSMPFSSRASASAAAPSLTTTPAAAHSRTSSPLPSLSLRFGQNRFSASAASSSKKNRHSLSVLPLTSSEEPSDVERLGRLGCKGGGLYLVLHFDDIHTTSQYSEALRQFLGSTSLLSTDSILKNMVTALRKYGQLVVWGTMEIISECGADQARLWLGGFDSLSAARVGNIMLERAALLNKTHGLHCSILTLDELKSEQRAVAVLQWLISLARSCDPLCQKVAESIRPDNHLVPLLLADFKLNTRITKYWHSLLLTLLAVPTFKSHLAAAYCDTYQMVTSEYARGMGVLERSGYALSVQFLNRVTYVVDLVQGRDLLGKLGRSLLQTLQVACLQVASPNGSPGTSCRRLNPSHFVLAYRRYSPCISDLKCVLNVKGMPRLFASESGTFLQDWIASLALGQYMDPQVWRDFTQAHIEVEVREWVGAFNASISLGSLFERLLAWDDSDPSPITDPNSSLSKNLMSCVELTLHVLVTGIAAWQEREMRNFQANLHTPSLEGYRRKPASLPFSTVAASRGTSVAFKALPMSQITPFSFHLPLHRFVAACLREVCLREGGMNDLINQVNTKIAPEDRDSLFVGLMEFPLQVLARAAQVRAGLWRRNGPGLNDQVLNYAEPPFCRSMRDADLLLAQFAMMGRSLHQGGERPSSDVGVSFLVHLLLHRLGVFDFLGLATAPQHKQDKYLEGVMNGHYDRELKPLGAQETPLPVAYSPARDSSSSLLLTEEFLHIMMVLAAELPPVPPLTKEKHTLQAKSRLRREVVHRLASGPKTHSELAEVHHVLSHWDNMLLSEEGKTVNPDDATGAALEAVLADVADRKVSRGKMQPDKWELRSHVWDSYDPSFFHISLRAHQTAAEYRPKPSSKKEEKKRHLFGIHAKPLAPRPIAAHPQFTRLRRDVPSDATLLAIVYRIIHMHCRDNNASKQPSGIAGSAAYESPDRSETALARAVHILTLGAYAWEGASDTDTDWRSKGGGSAGSIFSSQPDHDGPTAKDWVDAVLLCDPEKMMANDWYNGEESMLQLLRRLAVDGGVVGSFVAQDAIVRSGAAWLCEFAANNNTKARVVLGADRVTESRESDSKESDIQRRKRIAKQKAMERMKAQAAKFTQMMGEELGNGNDSDGMVDSDSGGKLPQTPGTPVQNRQTSFGSVQSYNSSQASISDADRSNSTSQVASMGEMTSSEGDHIPQRLLKSRPQCIICNDDPNAEVRTNRDAEEFGHRKSRRRRMEGSNALAFVGYIQASTILKGGSGPPSSSDFYSPLNPVRRFVGTHVALCGHAVHSECWESYLASVSHREDRTIGKRDEFRCPLCQRLSNCLVPFIDVGVDWIGSATTCQPVSMGKTPEGQVVQDVVSTTMTTKLELEEFLTSTPWWVSKHANSVVWDGHSAFINSSTNHGMHDDALSQLLHPDQRAPDELRLGQDSRMMRRRSVRSLRKKDLYAAWNAMMKTPRFVKRKLRAREAGIADVNIAGQEAPATGRSSSSSDTSGETLVWRRFMDQVSDISYRADGKRLGDENLHNDFGEFRHYIVEKYTFNMANRFAGKDPSDWPSCVFSTPLPDTQRQELSREKLLSKLLMSIQSFSYSCCCESHEIQRLLRAAATKSSNLASAANSDTVVNPLFSKFGVADVVCDGKLVIMKEPSISEDEGGQPFSGRLGKLRYLGLSVTAAAGAVAADLTQLVLQFPTGADTNGASGNPHRSPIAFPILYGHVLTHVVAALCASCGRARARSDSLEVVWPVPFSRRGSFVSDNPTPKKGVDSVVEDCEGFVKLGWVARTLQVLLGKIEMSGLSNVPGVDIVPFVIKTLRKIRSKELNDSAMKTQLDKNWVRSCLTLLEIALCHQHTLDESAVPENTYVENAIIERFYEGCNLAAAAGCSFLSDVGIVTQILLPGIVHRYGQHPQTPTDDEGIGNTNLQKLEEFRAYFGLESLSSMLESEAMQEVVANWYATSTRHSALSTLPSEIISGSGAVVNSRLFRTQGYRVFDWPMESCRPFFDTDALSSKSNEKMDTTDAEPQDESVVPMEIDTIQSSSGTSSAGQLHQYQTTSPGLVAHSTKKSVPLLGGYTAELTDVSHARPRISTMPISYTDLYAELGKLLPDSEQTAVCLVCGEVLNAGGKGECTRHSYKCGAGAGMFFLLQECSGLIMHNAKAAYIHSPYVDSHGETPQYRGRPLNLDLDRYGHFNEVWSGHTVRQLVLAERASSRQIILQDFY